MVHVLFVDDDPWCMQHKIEMLREKGGHEVCVTTNLAEAIVALRGGIYAVVVLDKNIGGHRGCVPFIELVRRERPETKIIMHSGEESWHIPGLLGCNDFVFKGASDREALLNAVNRWTAKIEKSAPEKKSRWDTEYGEDYFADRL